MADGDEDDDDDDDGAGVGAGASTTMDVDEPKCEEKDPAELVPVLMREYLASGVAVKGRNSPAARQTALTDGREQPRAASRGSARGFARLRARARE